MEESCLILEEKKNTTNIQMNYVTNFGSISLNRNILYILYCLNINILYILYYLSFVRGKLAEQNIIGSYFKK